MCSVIYGDSNVFTAHPFSLHHFSNNFQNLPAVKPGHDFDKLLVGPEVPLQNLEAYRLKGYITISGKVTDVSKNILTTCPKLISQNITISVIFLFIPWFLQKWTSLYKMCPLVSTFIINNISFLTLDFHRGSSWKGHEEEIDQHHRRPSGETRPSPTLEGCCCARQRCL